jgi:hypothetical protein
VAYERSSLILLGRRQSEISRRRGFDHLLIFQRAKVPESPALIFLPRILRGSLAANFARRCTILSAMLEIAHDDLLFLAQPHAREGAKTTASRQCDALAISGAARIAALI